MMDMPPHSLPQLDAPAIEWLHVMPPADSADLVLGYEAAYPFLQTGSSIAADGRLPSPVLDDPTPR